MSLRIATISGLTIRNGADGIDNLGGTLTVKNCVISGNSATAFIIPPRIWNCDRDDPQHHGER